MKCPKCGFHSFEFLDQCKKCGLELGEHKKKYNIRGFFSPTRTEFSQEGKMANQNALVSPQNIFESGVGIEPLEEEQQLSNSETDNHTDSHNEKNEESLVKFDNTETEDLLGERFEINLDQPFSIDSETLPADEPSSTELGKGKKD